MLTVDLQFGEGLHGEPEGGLVVGPFVQVSEEGVLASGLGLGLGLYFGGIGLWAFQPSYDGPNGRSMGSSSCSLSGKITVGFAGPVGYGGSVLGTQWAT